MKKINTLILPTILVGFTLFSFTGCEDKKVQETIIPVENTTEILTVKKEEKQDSQGTEETIVIQKESIHKEFSEGEAPAGTFTLRDIRDNSHTLSLVNQKMTFQTIDNSIVLLNFFSTWSASSCGEIPYLSDLQEKYKKDLFIAGILVNDVLQDNMLKEFISKYHTNYFISNHKQNDALFSKVIKALHLPENVSLPLTVIYKNGDYYTHYEGAVPVEMIDHDIRQVIKK